jgi:hypothetical protein
MSWCCMCMCYIDTFSNILYVMERKAELSHLAHTCVKVYLAAFITEAALFRLMSLVPYCNLFLG